MVWACMSAVRAVGPVDCPVAKSNLLSMHCEEPTVESPPPELVAPVSTEPYEASFEVREDRRLGFNHDRATRRVRT